MISWLIVGGGIHGTYLSHLLVNQAGLDPAEVRVLDPDPEPLSAWHRNTARCGMRYLRSPATHNIDLPVLSLYRFARPAAAENTAAYIPPYNRPSLELFRRHCAHVIRRFGLQELRIAGRAIALHKSGRSVTAETTAGSITARNVLLAIGLGEQPHWPAWASRLRASAQIFHLFDPHFRLTDISAAADGVVVVGAGVSAVQTSLMLSDRLDGSVRLVSRHDLRPSPYDFDPCWIGPKCLRGFYRQDIAGRRAAIDRARIGGSLPAEVQAELDAAIGANRLGFQKSRIRRAVAEGGRIRLDTDGKPLWADTVVLATGFRSHRPGGEFVDQVIDEFDLACGPCGYPVVGGDLRWSANIFVTGPLAELQLGPCARNIIGARNAGRLLMGALKSRH